MTHTSTKQPEALRLAGEYRKTMPSDALHLWADDVVGELRRQHARIAELEAELAAAQWGDARRMEMLTTIEDSGEGLRYGLECLVNNGVNTFTVYDEQRAEYMGDGWLTDPCAAIDAALAAQAKQGEQP